MRKRRYFRGVSHRLNAAGGVRQRSAGGGAVVRGMAWQARCGWASSGNVRYGKVGWGLVRQAWSGKVRQGRVRLGYVRQAWPGKVGWDEIRFVTVTRRMGSLAVLQKKPPL